MRVIVDYERCQSNANCLDECPEVFALDAEDLPVVLCEHPAEDLRDKVEFAATCCPRSAITVLSDDPADGDADEAKVPPKFLA
jgi:ferredoxin